MKLDLHFHGPIIIHSNDDGQLKEVLSELKIIKTQNSQIMATFAELKTEFDNLKTAIAEERAQATAKLAELQTSIDNLTANIQNGGTNEERDSLLSDIRTQIAEVKAIIPDPATPPTETQP